MRIVLVAVPPIMPRAGEGWRRYRARVAPGLAQIRRRAQHAAALGLQPLYAANALYGLATDEQLRALRHGALGTDVALVEGVRPRPMGSAIGIRPAALSIGGEEAQPTKGSEPLRLAPTGDWSRSLAGRGVKVAVLDSGIDRCHPHLAVAASVSACPEPVRVPGQHGTHCAGVIACRSREHLGVAPAVELLNIKVARADGMTHAAYIARGIDLALDRGADVLSISVGLNHFPIGIWGGHGWTCPDGRCLLCRAVDHATGCCPVVVVAAAGNEHLRAGRIRSRGCEPMHDTEILCPGQARSALTVGAIEHESNPRLFPFSSYGPTSYGLFKPELVAPGVDVTSTIPHPSRKADSPRCFSDLFGTGSGSSVATARVAGIVALLVARRRDEGGTWSAQEIRAELLSRHGLPMAAGFSTPPP